MHSKHIAQSSELHLPPFERRVGSGDEKYNTNTTLHGKNINKKGMNGYILRYYLV